MKSLNKITGKLIVPRLKFEFPGQEELRYGAQISVWIRWFVIASCLVEVNYGVQYGSTSHILTTLYSLSPAPFNGYTHYRLWSNRPMTLGWLFLVSLVDVAQISTSVVISGGFSGSYFVLYYPALVMFAVVFVSFKWSFAWATVVAVIYGLLSLTFGPGLDFEAQDEKVLFGRIVVMYAVVASVNLMIRFDRVRRREAVERTREVQRERTELSQIIHDTTAQSAYMIGLGIETAMEFADKSNRKLVESLQATHAVAKSAIWELRHPIDIGLIYEGSELSHVLRSHAARFTQITGIPAEVVQSGPEPALTPVTRSLLFAIAHNAMTNSFRHSGAGKVHIALDFGPDVLSVSVADDGIGLPDDYAERGHGFRNMAVAARTGGWQT